MPFDKLGRGFAANQRSFSVKTSHSRRQLLPARAASEKLINVETSI